MGNIIKGILYTGLAGIVGIGGYMIGKYKHLGGKVSLTMVGLALVLYAPKGCDVAETYIRENATVERARIYGSARKDSIDAVVNYERARDSTLYLKQFIQNVSSASKQLEATYKGIIMENENRYKNLLQKNDAQYDKVLGGMIKQNEILKKDLVNLKTATSSSQVFENKTVTENKTNTDVKAPAKFHIDPMIFTDPSNIVGVKKTAEGNIEYRAMPDGTIVAVTYKR